MTAAQPGAEGVQGEVTAAVERAARKYANLTGSGMESALRVTPHALADALDVEEMARAIHASDFPDDDWDQEVHTGLRDECLKNARAVRAQILGSAS